MLKSKKLFAIVALILCMSMLFATTAFAAEPNSTGDSIRCSTLEGLNPDTIIAYFQEIPICAKDIDENGNFDIDSLIRSRAPSECNMRISSSNRNKAIYLEGVLTTTGFSQTETYIYMPNNSIADMYLHLSASNVDAAVTFLISLIPYIGTTIGLAVLLRGFAMNDLMTRLDNIRRSGNDAYLLEIRSPYGIFNSVHEWDGWTIAGKDYYNPAPGGARYSVNKIEYGVTL